MSATVSRDATGKYWCSICCQEENYKPTPFKKTGKQVGVDLGIADFAILSNGKKIENPQYLQKALDKLKREQRILSRRIERAKAEGRKLSECKNVQKQRRKVAKVYERVKNLRSNFLHTESKKMLKKYDLIAIEDLNVKDMMKDKDKGKGEARKKTRRLAKTRARNVSDVSFYEFRRQLTYKADWYGKDIRVIDRYFPSSQLCHECGYQNPITKDESVREWTCPKCGHHHDRDINAAKNILREGLKTI